MEACQTTQSTSWFHYHASSFSHPFISCSSFFFSVPIFHVIFPCNRSPASPSPCQGGGFALRAGWPGLLWVRSEAGVAQEGGRPSTGTQHITRYFIVPFYKNPGSLFVGWLIGAVLTVMRLCSGRLQAAMWSCRSCWEKFWCIRAASWASMLFPQALFRSDGRRSLWQSESTSRVILCWFSHIVIFAKPWPLLIQLWLHYSVMYWCHSWKRTRCLCLLCKGIAPCITISCFTLLEA